MVGTGVGVGVGVDLHGEGVRLAPPTRASPQPTSRRVTKRCMRPSAAGAISSTRSTCAPPTTAARTASNPTYNSAGSRCCRYASPKPKQPPAGATSATSLTACTSSPLAISEGTVSQRTELTPDQRHILKALELPEPPCFYDFTPPPISRGL
mgnify:CR=1 FL=1